MGKIRWTEKASSNLEGIFEYISRDSRLYAARYVRALIAATKRLETMPRSGRVVPEFEDPELREVIYGNYRIVYRVAETNKDIEILAVVHGARDMSGVFRED
ncbi:MAG: type II toxin-antitoxin system RelE/ParE family toxin, partial [Proteobacteria bacterium]|nr:type II toxin-antitoxin system RelE/ParE family toxin [Pseudomonadota bacterium]